MRLVTEGFDRVDLAMRGVPDTTSCISLVASRLRSFCDTARERAMVDSPPM